MTHKVQKGSYSSDTPSTTVNEISSLLAEAVVDKALAWTSSTSRIICSAKSVNALWGIHHAVDYPTGKTAWICFVHLVFATCAFIHKRVGGTRNK